MNLMSPPPNLFAANCLALESARAALAASIAELSDALPKLEIVVCMLSSANELSRS